MSVNINIEGEGLTYKGSTSILKASQVIAFLSADQEANRDIVPHPSSLLAPISFSSKSPREVLIETKANTNSQKILVFAKYYCDQEKVEDFQPSLLKSLFKRSGEPEPKNYSRDVREAVRLGYIYEAENIGQFQITDFGRSLLEQGFPSAPKSSPTKKTQKNNRQSSPAKNVSPEVISLEVMPKIDSGDSYHDLSTKSDKILWILYFAYKNNIQELTTAEIEHIADRLRDNIPTKSISALTEASLKKAYLTRANSGKLKILHDGINFIEKSGRSDI